MREGRTVSGDPGGLEWACRTGSQQNPRAATSGVQGSGWGVPAYEPLGGRLVVEQVYDHHGNVGMNTTPLPVFDAWEHAYYLHYRNVRPDYVEKLWGTVNWDDVARRFADATSQAG
ncbi:Fe-Mn family superoxide dismutase [Nonomuraea africana]|uniref:superoxide dismutase n=1 Tax=Nonomuraea africana TaxID=46171 RepID=A0ABR9KN09_9ACTN|nr:Fe-Mn family superoxide dismutase [Nonomuraea africana]MBE1563403.1 superoxide dismutase [Nonomuraea africana]